jgi:hypothetical protein
MIYQYTINFTFDIGPTYASGLLYHEAVAANRLSYL